MNGSLKFIAAALGLAWSSVPVAAAPGPPPGYTLLHEERSPRGTFIIQHYSSPEYKHQVWLASAEHPQQRRRLFRPREEEGIDYDPDFLVSGDERWIARTQKTGSTRFFVALYRREAPLTYVRVAPALEGAAWRLLGTSLGLSRTAVPPHHRYLEALRWSDSGTLLLRLSGNNCPAYGLANWYCLFDARSGVFTVPARYAGSNHRARLACVSN